LCFLDKLVTKDNSVIRISVADDGSVNLTFREGLEEVVVKPLS